MYEFTRSREEETLQTGFHLAIHNSRRSEQNKNRIAEVSLIEIEKFAMLPFEVFSIFLCRRIRQDGFSITRLEATSETTKIFAFDTSKFDSSISKIFFYFCMFNPFFQSLHLILTTSDRLTHSPTFFFYISE